MNGLGGVEEGWITGREEFKKLRVWSVGLSRLLCILQPSKNSDISSTGESESEPRTKISGK